MIKLETHRGAAPFRRRFFFFKKKQGPGARDLYGAPTRIDFRQRGPTAYRLVLRVIRLAALGWTRIAHSWPVGRPYPSVMKKSGMSNWAPLAPSKPGGPSKSPAARFTSVLKPTKPSALGSTSSGPLIGRWPESILLRIVESLPVPDLPNVARSSRALSRIVRDERGWEARCRILEIKSEDGEGSRPWDFIVRSY